jgi:hypothetical protein
MFLTPIVAHHLLVSVVGKMGGNPERDSLLLLF